MPKLCVKCVRSAENSLRAFERSGRYAIDLFVAVESVNIVMTYLPHRETHCQHTCTMTADAATKLFYSGHVKNFQLTPNAYQQPNHRSWERRTSTLRCMWKSIATWTLSTSLSMFGFRGWSRLWNCINNIYTFFYLKLDIINYYRLLISIEFTSIDLRLVRKFECRIEDTCENSHSYMNCFRMNAEILNIDGKDFVSYCPPKTEPSNLWRLFNFH